jgi:hypothetical protein
MIPSDVSCLTGYQLRRLFAMILIQFGPADPELLWHAFCENICDDLQCQIPLLFPNCQNPTQEDVYN